ncbi:flagellar motor protein MotB [Marinibaculum pumilum]|uniref:Flagellar motor protein MotB n=1 Tax=Marinibaculum pumilum TaxID=1766165 RepID=A0ABV7L4C5_9PROT
MELFQTPAQLRDADFQAQAEMERRRVEARDRRLRIPEPETLKRREKIPAPIWMVTMADLIALILTFFVLMFALSTTNPMTWQAIRESLADSLRRSNPAASLGEQNDLTEMPHITVSLGADLTYLGAVLESKAASVPLLQAGDIIRRHDRLVVSLPTDLLFQPASAELEPDAIPALNNMANLLNTVRNQVAVEGHAGAVGGDAGLFEANWQLSLSRAVAVAEALQRAGFTGAIVPMGRGDGDDEMPDASGPDGERLARRVDIVIRSGRSAAPPGGSLRSPGGTAR